MLLDPSVRIRGKGDHMKDIFIESASQIDHSIIQEWKAGGGKIIGYTCSFMPLEICDAANILPVRIRGIDQNHASDDNVGDVYYGPYVCRYPKALLQLAVDGVYQFLDGAVVSTGCDAMRRLDDCWRKANQDHHGILPAFFHYFDVPQKVEIHAQEWFSKKVTDLIQSIETHFNVNITHERLINAIRLRNRIRKLLWELECMRCEKNSRVSGTVAFAVLISSNTLPPQLFVNYLEQFINQIKQEKQISTKNPKRRLMVSGSIADDISLIKLIEDSGDTVVSAENLCFGVRHACDQVMETGNLIDNMSKRYLSKSICPRMFGNYQARWACIKDKLIRAHIDGVILQNVRFCDLHGTDNGLLEKDIQSINIPVLRLEREYGAITDIGRLKMRIDAFTEQLSTKED